MSKPAKRTTKPDVVKPEYEATPADRRAARDLFEKRHKGSPYVRLKIENKDGEVDIQADYPDQGAGQVHLMAAFNVTDYSLYGRLVEDLANLAIVDGGGVSEVEVNALLGIVREIRPRDATEALLVVQMAAIHRATITAARRLKRVDTIPQQDSASNMLAKLARVFTSQLEALKRYRSTGEQNVRVTHQHVNVNANQAVVGINPGGGGAHENASQSHAPEKTTPTSTVDAAGPALLGHEQTLAMPLPSASREGPQGVPHARGTSRSAKGQG